MWLALTFFSGVGEALKTLGFRVYDFQAASRRYKRDFPLWVEAAHLCQAGRPYNKSDYDKLIGDYDAVVGAPASVFGYEFVKLYPNVKVIMVTGGIDQKHIQASVKKIRSRIWQLFDPIYFGSIRRFLELTADQSTQTCANNDQIIREAVREKNLLVIHSLLAWVPLCEFFGVKVPDASISIPKLHSNTTMAELTARPQLAVLEIYQKASRRIMAGFVSIFRMASVTLVSAVAAALGGVCLFQLSSTGLYLFYLLVARSLIRDTTRLAAAGLALITFVCGVGAGYSVALLRSSKPEMVESPPHDYRRRNDNVRRRGGGRGRGRQPDNDENRRPERPTLDGWSGVQENIRKDDAEMIKDGNTAFEEWKGKHVTFNVTHKCTESDQELSNGLRKVLSVTKETVE